MEEGWLKGLGYEDEDWQGKLWAAVIFIFGERVEAWTSRANDGSPGTP